MTTDRDLTEEKKAAASSNDKMKRAGIYGATIWVRAARQSG